MNAVNKIAAVLLLVNALTALAGGILMMLDPTGKWSQLSLTLLVGTPFASFFIPGVYLTLMIGLFSLLVIFLWIKKYKYTGRLLFLEGIFLIAYIATQVYYMDEYLFLQPIYMVMGFYFVIASFILQPNKETELI